MCGIVAASSRRNITPILLEGLRRLEYRGFDSCGIAVIESDGASLRPRTVQRVASLIRQADEETLSGGVGIAHTRWATHGAPEVRNAHPMISHDTIALVHNGIIENYAELKAELVSAGFVLYRETDTEVIAHLVYRYFEGNLLDAVAKAVSRLRGSFGLAVCCTKQPDVVVGARRGSPLVMGLGDKENFLASDVLALAGVTERFIFLEEGDIAEITPDSSRIFRATEDGRAVPVDREVKIVSAHDNDVALGPYRHYMQKEIFEQPRAIADTLEGVAGITPSIFGANAESVFRKGQRILILACGTSFYAGLTAKYWLEAIAGIPCEVEIASEYRYRVSVPHEDQLVVCISQSGETSDTLSALEHAKSLGMHMTLAICNVATSALVHNTELHYITRAGAEIGVASTKAFTGQVTVLSMLALTIAQQKGTITQARFEEMVKELQGIPEKISMVLKNAEPVKELSKIFTYARNFIYLGRGYNYPAALEGALKLKEISYIHAEGYPAAEMKHGPIALIDAEMPVVAIATTDSIYEKTISNIQEIKARKGKVIAIVSEGDQLVHDIADYCIEVPHVLEPFAPLVASIPLQLLAYYIAVNKGRNVDQPRNLAKSVTVE